MFHLRLPFFFQATWYQMSPKEDNTKAILKSTLNCIQFHSQAQNDQTKRLGARKYLYSNFFPEYTIVVLSCKIA